jgi:hypothetical protein
MHNGYGLAGAHNAKIAINSYMRCTECLSGTQCPERLAGMRCTECLAGMQSLEGLAGAVPPSNRPGPTGPSCHLRSREPEGIGTILA